MRHHQPIELLRHRSAGLHNRCMKPLQSLFSLVCRRARCSATFSPWIFEQKRDCSQSRGYSVCVTLACVAGARKGREKGNWARGFLFPLASRAPDFLSPFPFLAPATQASVTFVGTDFATLPSQCWFTRLVRRIPKNNIERGKGGTRTTFSTWLWSVLTKHVYNCSMRGAVVEFCRDIRPNLSRNILRTPHSPVHKLMRTVSFLFWSFISTIRQSNLQLTIHNSVLNSFWFNLSYITMLLRSSQF